LGGLKRRQRSGLRIQKAGEDHVAPLIDLVDEAIVGMYGHMPALIQIPSAQRVYRCKAVLRGAGEYIDTSLGPGGNTAAALGGYNQIFLCPIIEDLVRTGVLTLFGTGKPVIIDSLSKSSVFVPANCKDILCAETGNKNKLIGGIGKEIYGILTGDIHCVQIGQKAGIRIDSQGAGTAKITVDSIQILTGLVPTEVGGIIRSFHRLEMIPDACALIGAVDFNSISSGISFPGGTGTNIDHMAHSLYSPCRIDSRRSGTILESVCIITEVGKGQNHD
jgi:hypothetical protein